MKMTWLLLLLALAGCDDRRKTVEENIRSDLKDPASAQFGKDFKGLGDGDSVFACGTVNARNSFGGYVGEKPYMVWNRQLFIGAEDTSANIIACCEAVYSESKAGKAELSQETSYACASLGDSSFYGASE